MINPKNERLSLVSDSFRREGEFHVVNDSLIFSSDARMCESKLKSIKFHITDQGKVNNFGEGDPIGFLVSGDLELFQRDDASNNHGAVKWGSLDNLQSDLVMALRSLSSKLSHFDPEELPIKMYMVGQAALQYWDGESKMSISTKDIDIVKTEPYDLFEMKKFYDIIKIIDAEIKQLEDDDQNPNEDLIINNDAASQRFPFEIQYHCQIIDESILLLYVGDKESIELNKIYAFFESYLSSDKIRFKDMNFTNAWLHRMGIYDAETLMNRFPQFGEIQEVNQTWNKYFDDFC